MFTDVSLVPYDDNWPQQFEDEKKRIQQTIDLPILAIEHVGSTSIPNMKAKPIIDILVGLEILQHFENFIQPLSQIGYEYVEHASTGERKFFRKGLAGKGSHHLHLCEIGGTEWAEKLVFRNQLRNNPVLAREYEALKIKLAVTYAHNRPTYTKMKAPFIQNVLRS